jgi:hypothetical protein
MCHGGGPRGYSWRVRKRIPGSWRPALVAALLGASLFNDDPPRAAGPGRGAESSERHAEHAPRRRDARGRRVHPPVRRRGRVRGDLPAAPSSGSDATAWRKRSRRSFDRRREQPGDGSPEGGPGSPSERVGECAHRDSAFFVQDGNRNARPPRRDGARLANGHEPNRSLLRLPARSPRAAGGGETSPGSPASLEVRESRTAGRGRGRSQDRRWARKHPRGKFVPGRGSSAR